MSLILIIVVVLILIIMLTNKKRRDNNVTIIRNVSDEKLNREFSNKLIYEDTDKMLDTNLNIDSTIIMVIEDVFCITGRGTVVTGKIINGDLKVGDNINIQDSALTKSIPSAVTGIEMFRKTLTVANVGDLVGVLLKDVAKDEIHVGNYITK